MLPSVKFQRMPITLTSRMYNVHTDFIFVILKNLINCLSSSKKSTNSEISQEHSLLLWIGNCLDIGLYMYLLCIQKYYLKTKYGIYNITDHRDKKDSIYTSYYGGPGFNSQHGGKFSWLLASSAFPQFPRQLRGMCYDCFHYHPSQFIVTIIQIFDDTKSELLTASLNKS